MAETLLDIVQGLLSDTDGDQVESIADTEDSEQVARIVKGTYEAMMSRSVWPHTRRALQLVARADSDYPTHMSINDNLKELISVAYDKRKVGVTRKDFKEVKYLEPDDFLRKINNRDSTASNVVIVEDDSGIDLLILNDTAPTYFTSFNDVDLIFDSYDSAVDSTIQASKVQALGYVIPEFTLEDSSVPDLPVDAVVALKEESRARVNYMLRQLPDPVSQQESGRQSRWLARKNWAVNPGGRYPDYGRGRGTYSHKGRTK